MIAEFANIRVRELGGQPFQLGCCHCKGLVAWLRRSVVLELQRVRAWRRTEGGVSLLCPLQLCDAEDTQGMLESVYLSLSVLQQTKKIDDCICNLGRAIRGDRVKPLWQERKDLEDLLLLSGRLRLLMVPIITLTLLHLFF